MKIDFNFIFWRLTLKLITETPKYYGIFEVYVTSLEHIVILFCFLSRLGAVPSRSMQRSSFKLHRLSYTTSFIAWIV